MKKCVIIFSIISLSHLLWGAQELAVPTKNAAWAHDVSDLKPDPRVKWGVLENGFKYALMHNKEPKDRVSLRLAVKVGSLMEEEDERGLAHFLEHMAFNGTRHFPKATVIEFLQRNGMEFGGDTNAHTGFDETVYQLELPKQDLSLIEEGLRIFRDFADGLLLEEKEIERERGVILAEKKARDSNEYRNWKAMFRFQLQGTLPPKRLPIGSEKVIKTATRETFLKFYKKWYRPGRMSVVIVGDCDITSIEPLVNKVFGSLERPSEVPSEPDLGHIEGPKDSKITAKFHLTKDTDCCVSLMSVKEETTKDTKAIRTKKVLSSFVMSMLNKRLEILSKKETAPFAGSGAGVGIWFKKFLTSEVSLSCSDSSKWKEALQSIEQEARRTRLGFSEREIKEETLKQVNAAEEVVRQKETRRSEGLAYRLANCIINDEVFTSPEDDLTLTKEAIALLSPQKSIEVAQELLGDKPHHFRIWVQGNGESILLKTFEESAKKTIPPAEQEKNDTFAYTKFGKESKVISKKEIKDLEVVQIRLENNIRLTLKKTNFEDNKIYIRAQFGNGLIDELLSKKTGIGFLAQEVFISGGLEKHSADDIERLFAGKSVAVNFGVGDDHFTMQGETNKIDFRDCLNLMCAYFTAPGYREEALWKAHKNMEIFYDKLNTEVGLVYHNKGQKYLACNDPRFGFPSKEVAFSLKMPDVKAFLDNALRKSYMEIVVVGDFDIEPLMATMVSTFGALPARDTNPQSFEKERIINFPKGLAEARFDDVQTEINKGIVSVCWPTVDAWQIKETRPLGLLASILDDRLRLEVRQKAGEVYRFQVESSSSYAYKNRGIFSGTAFVVKENAQRVTDAIQNIAKDIADKGITADELTRAKEPLLANILRQLRDNRYWISMLSLCQQHPEAFDWIRSMEPSYKAITIKDINECAKKYIVPSKTVRILVLPK